MADIVELQENGVAKYIKTHADAVEGLGAVTVAKTGNETVAGLKNFQDGIQSAGEAVLTKTSADLIYAAKSTGEVLWSGTSTLNSTHTLTPSKALADCQNGWLLVFAPFNGNTAQNYDVTTEFVPKGHNRLTVCQVFNGSAFTTKRYQCSTTAITGHSSNVGTEQIKAALIEIREV